MLEILVLLFLMRTIGGIVEAKGRRSLGYKALTALLWVGGEITGASIGVALAGDSGGCAIYLFALVGAAAGAGISFTIANSLSPVRAV